jgi:hypothetical protein
MELQLAPASVPGGAAGRFIAADTLRALIPLRNAGVP